MSSIFQNNPFEAVEDKIAAARTRLILDKPFLGTLVLRLPLQSADPSWCPTTGTDARKFYYNPEYITSLKPDELQFVLAHEALHCALSHFSRRQHRVKHRWDLACDYAINPILLDEGLSPPPGIQVLSSYRDMTAEEIYPLLDDNDLSETMDQHLYDKQDQRNEGGQGQQDDPLNSKNQNPDEQGDSEQAKRNQGGEQDSKPNQPASSKQSDTEQQDYNPDQTGPLNLPPPTLSETELTELEEKWQQRMAGAAQQAAQSGKLSSVLKRLIEIKLKPKLPWRVLLSRYLTATSRDDYSWARPSTRRGGDAIFPSLKSTQIDAVIAVDVSGSISDQEMQQYLSEIDAIKGQVRARVTLIPCDSNIAKTYPQVFEPWEEITFQQHIQGGGGTDFSPVFDWVSHLDQTPDLLVYFTDAAGRFPETMPPYPVVWLVKGKKDVPWGERIQLN